VVKRLILAGAVALMGCGSGGSGVGGGVPEAGEDATIEDAEAAAPVDSGDASVPETGGGDAGADATTTSNPGKVTCTSTLTCDIDAGGVCCIPTAEDGGTPSCRPPSVPCEGPHYFCDEKADCLGGWVCCWVFNGYPASICVRGPCSSDPSQGAQRCKTDAECANGGPCVTQTCGDAGTIQACSKLPGCN
jgi:hypothetical protein